jgi:SAM-dependent methyltransferase
MKKKECEYTMTDISVGMLNMARSRLDSFSKNPLQNFSFPKDIKYIPFKEPLFYPDLNCHLGLENNESFSQRVQPDYFDIYLSNLSLHLVENPKAMLSEAHRILKQAGKIGLTVWGRKENSDFFTLIPGILKEFGVALPAKRSNFHLSDKDQVAKLLEESSFKNIITWYQWVPFDFLEKDEFSEVWQFPFYGELSHGVDDVTLSKIKEKVNKSYNDIISVKKQPMGIEILFAVASK